MEFALSLCAFATPYKSTWSTRIRVLSDIGYGSDRLQVRETAALHPIPPSGWPNNNTLAYPAIAYMQGDANAQDSQRSIPIATPIPLPYSARPQAVLRSMISSSTKGIHAYRPVEPCAIAHAEDITAMSDNSRPCTAETSTRCIGKSVEDLNVQGEASCPNQLYAAPKLTIRPISPNTLMALTEPFLMAWCTDPNFVIEPWAYTARDDRLDVMTPPNSPPYRYATQVNPWGY